MLTNHKITPDQIEEINRAFNYFTSVAKDPTSYLIVCEVAKRIHNSGIVKGEKILAAYYNDPRAKYHW